MPPHSLAAACRAAISRPHWPTPCLQRPGTRIDEKPAVRPYRPPFPADPRADQRARPGVACHRFPDDRSSRPGIRRCRQGDRCGYAAGISDGWDSGRLSFVRHRRLGGGARQHALTGGPGADVRDRPLRNIMAADGDKAGARYRVRAGRLAAWCGPGASGREARRGSRAPGQGGVRRAQRNLDRSHQPHPRYPRRHRSDRPSGAVHGRYDFFARLDRLPP